MRIGIISDTHGLLRPEALERLAGARHIIHAGDIGGPDIVPRLRDIAPTTAIRGNIDTEAWAAAYPAETVVTLAGRRLLVLHDIQDLTGEPAAAGLDAVVCGHSHRARIETRNGVLYLNPGSAGPRRFRLPITVATLDLDGEAMEPRIHEL